MAKSPQSNENSFMAVSEYHGIGIAAISAHTNLDFAKGGVSSCLADILEIEKQEQIFSGGIPQGVIGTVREERMPSEFAMS